MKTISKIIAVMLLAIIPVMVSGQQKDKKLKR
jgi:hypothetical protein